MKIERTDDGTYSYEGMTAKEGTFRVTGVAYWKRDATTKAVDFYDKDHDLVFMALNCLWIKMTAKPLPKLT